MAALVNTAEEGAGLFHAERITANKQPMREPAAGDPETGCGPGPGRARNSWVRLESNGYSVHPAVIGQLIQRRPRRLSNVTGLAVWEGGISLHAPRFCG